MLYDTIENAYGMYHGTMEHVYCISVLDVDPITMNSFLETMQVPPTMQLWLAPASHWLWTSRPIHSRGKNNNDGHVFTRVKDIRARVDDSIIGVATWIKGVCIEATVDASQCSTNKRSTMGSTKMLVSDYYQLAGVCKHSTVSTWHSTELTAQDSRLVFMSGSHVYLLDFSVFVGF